MGASVQMGNTVVSCEAEMQEKALTVNHIA